MLETARLADRLGYDLLAVQDHPYHPYQPAHLDTLALLGVILGQTEQIRVFQDVANLPLRPPAMFAKAAATLDVLSVGRFEAGLGGGGFLRARPQSVETAVELGRVWRGLQREDVFPVSIRALVSALRGQRDHLVSDRGLRRLVRRYLEFDELADAATPLHVVAFDVVEGCEVLLSDGPAVDVISAAASIPGMFPPVSIGERRLIDGCVVNNTPISHAVELGAERIYVLPTYDGSQRLRPVPRGALDAAVHGLSLLIDGRLKVDIARYCDEVERIVLPAPNPLQVQPSEFGYASRLMRDALTASRELLARGDPVVSTRRRAAARQPEPASGESRTAIGVARHDIAAG